MANILVVSKYYYPFNGGIEENVRLISEYAAQFHDVTVIASNHEPGNSVDVVNGVTVRRRHVHWLFKSQPISLGLFSGIKLGDYDLVHFHSPNPFATGVLLAKFLSSTSRPIVITHHMDIFGRALLRALTLPLIRTLFRKAAVTIATSEKNVLVSKDLPRDLTYKVVPLAIAPERFVIDDQIRREAREWRETISGDAPLVGFVGRHARYKGLEVLMEALATLPKVHAVIGGDGPYRANAEKRASELGLQDRVHFLGRLSHGDKLKLLAALDIFTFPSTEVTEAFGISQMEAMACGVPVVASNLPTGVTDVAIDRQTALLARPGDAVDLANKISELLENRQLAKRLADAGRRHILSNMTNDTISRKTIEIFEEVMNVEPTALEKRLA